MSTRYSIIFCGTSAFAIPSLEALVNNPDFDVKLVITQPDRPVGRKQILTPPPVKVIAEKHGILLFQPQNINTEIFNFQLPIFNFLIVVSYGQILSQKILDLPTIAPINVHASLLPRYRGASPLQHAILNGDKESGVTIQKMVYNLDAGPILAQEKMTLDPRETFTTLHDRLSTLGADLLIKTLTSPLHPAEQDEIQATICRELKKEDGKIDPIQESAEHIDRKVRALTPWPGVWMDTGGSTLKILETSLEATEESTPLSCKDSTLHLVTVQPAGKKPMSGAEWARGRE